MPTFLAVQFLEQPSRFVEFAVIPVRWVCEDEGTLECFQKVRVFYPDDHQLASYYAVTSCPCDRRWKTYIVKIWHITNDYNQAEKIITEELEYNGLDGAVAEAEIQYTKAHKIYLEKIYKEKRRVQTGDMNIRNNVMRPTDKPGPSLNIPRNTGKAPNSVAKTFKTNGKICKTINIVNKKNVVKSKNNLMQRSRQQLLNNKKQLTKENCQPKPTKTSERQAKSNTRPLQTAKPNETNSKPNETNSKPNEKTAEKKHPNSAVTRLIQTNQKNSKQPKEAPNRDRRTNKPSHKKPTEPKDHKHTDAKKNDVPRTNQAKETKKIGEKRKQPTRRDEKFRLLDCNNTWTLKHQLQLAPGASLPQHLQTLVKARPIYVDKDELAVCEATSKNAHALARNLLYVVFHRKALQICNVDELDQKGLYNIIKYVLTASRYYKECNIYGSLLKSVRYELREIKKSARKLSREPSISE